jgi:hypothetical protein
MRKFTYDTEKLYKEYVEHLHNSFPSLFPALTDQDVNTIVRYQFIMLHREMHKFTLRSVRFKYLGIFHVPKSRAIGYLNKIKILFANHRVEKAYLDAVDEAVNNHVNIPENEKITS